MKKNTVTKPFKKQESFLRRLCYIISGYRQYNPKGLEEDNR